MGMLLEVETNELHPSIFTKTRSKVVKSRKLWIYKCNRQGKIRQISQLCLVMLQTLSVKMVSLSDLPSLAPRMDLLKFPQLDYTHQPYSNSRMHKTWYCKAPLIIALKCLESVKTSTVQFLQHDIRLELNKGCTLAKEKIATISLRLQMRRRL